MSHSLLTRGIMSREASASPGLGEEGAPPAACVGVGPPSLEAALVLWISRFSGSTFRLAGFVPSHPSGLTRFSHSCGAWCAARPAPRGADVQRSELQDSEVRVSGSLFGQVSGIPLFFSKLFRRLRVLRKHCVVGFLPAGGGPREGRRLEVSAGEELRDVWLRECRSPPPVCVKGTWRRPHQALQMGAQPKGSLEEGARRKDPSDSATPPPSPGDSTHWAQPSGALLEHLHRKIKKTKSPHLSFF